MQIGGSFEDVVEWASLGRLQPVLAFYTAAADSTPPTPLDRSVALHSVPLAPQHAPAPAHHSTGSSAAADLPRGGPARDSSHGAAGTGFEPRTGPDVTLLLMSLHENIMRAIEREVLHALANVYVFSISIDFIVCQSCHTQRIGWHELALDTFAAVERESEQGLAHATDARTSAALSEVRDIARSGRQRCEGARAGP